MTQLIGEVWIAGNNLTSGQLTHYVGEDRLYAMSFACTNEIIDGDTLATATVSATPTNGLTVSAAAVPTTITAIAGVSYEPYTLVTFTLSGGTATNNSVITVTATTTDGSAVVGEGLLQIVA